MPAKKKPRTPAEVKKLSQWIEGGGNLWLIMKAFDLKTSYTIKQWVIRKRIPDDKLRKVMEIIGK